MRSSRTRCPPASAIATEIAIPACSALPIAVAIIFFAPACVRRLVAATYMAPTSDEMKCASICDPPSIFVSMIGLTHTKNQIRPLPIWYETEHGVVFPKRYEPDAGDLA